MVNLTKQLNILGQLNTIVFLKEKPNQNDMFTWLNCGFK